MKKIYIIIIGVLLIGIGGMLIFAENKQPSNSEKNSSNNQSKQNTVTNNKAEKNNSGGKKDSGFNLETLVGALEKEGYITEKEEELNTASEFKAEKVVKYGNILIVQYGNDVARYFEIYDEQKVNYQGKELKLGGAVGPYLLFFLDNQINEKVVKTFEQAGGYYR